MSQEPVRKTVISPIRGTNKTVVHEMNFDDAARTHASLVESLEKRKPKKKKLKIDKSKAKKVMATLILGAAIPVSIFGLYNSPKAKRERELKQAHDYVDNVIIAQILDEQGYKPINENLDVEVTKSKEEVNMLIDEVSRIMGVDRNTASYIVFSYYNNDNEVFVNLGYKDADDWARQHGYAVQDRWDTLITSDYDVFENYNEEDFLNATKDFQEGAEKVGNLDINDVHDYEVNHNER